jgi:hypothetical protein
MKQRFFHHLHSKLTRFFSFVFLALLVLETCTGSSPLVPTSLCNDTSPASQHLCQEKRALDQAIAQAQASGIPEIQLWPIYASEVQVSQASADDYSSQARQYQLLLLETQHLLFHQAQNSVHALLQQLQTEAESWGQAHAYRDHYDGQRYLLDGGYTVQGMSSILNSALAEAHTLKALQALLSKEQDLLFHLHLLEADSSDGTPFNAVHTTDLLLLQRYHLQKGQILLVSLVEQAMRVYQDGRLVRAFLVTTGRPEHPSLPGIWPTLMRFSPTLFVAPFPENSPNWFPPTPIHYAILYHPGGYFIHDAWWRADYGPGTQFPHADASGNTLFSGNGSHGCINLQEQAAAWLYRQTGWNTTIAIY